MKPLIYLNKRPHPITNESLILLFYKKSKIIEELLGQNEPVNFLKFLSCFVN